jgi:ferric-dicitrate binding protein FerR (iron transport regulator)
VGGRFETTDVEGFVDALQHLFGVRVLSVRSGGRGASTLVLLPSDRDA